MRVLTYFSPESLSNSYVVCGDDPTKSLLIDPKIFDLPFFEMLEADGIEISSVLVTHCDEKGAHAIRTLKRIYNFELYSGSDSFEGIAMHNVKLESGFSAGPTHVESLFLPGHFLDSLMYRIDDYLFPGDIMSAGVVNDTDGDYGTALLIQCLKESILDLPPQTLILPTFGPPSTIAIEKQSNPDLSRNIEEPMFRDYDS